MKNQILEEIKMYVNDVTSEGVNCISVDQLEDMAASIEHKILNQKDLKEASKPLMSYLAKNHHPHKIVIVENSSVTLYEGQKREATQEFIVD